MVLWKGSDEENGRLQSAEKCKVFSKEVGDI